MREGDEGCEKRSTHLFVNCETQEVVDELWERFSAGGRKDPAVCRTNLRIVGIVPPILNKLLQDKDPGEIKTSDLGNAADGQDRYRQIAAGTQRRVRPRR
jgi:hypothetical protein